MTQAVAQSPGAAEHESRLAKPDAPVCAGEQLVPGYRVVDHLARGEAYDVYEVYSLERSCSCVAKAMRPDHLDHERRRRRLRQEGELLARLSHPHLVRAYETVECDQLVVILEAVCGMRLDEIIDSRKRRLSAVEIAHLGTHIASATGYLHRHGFLHLDLKPENIVSEAGRAKLLDLSLARPPGEAPAGTGTRPYLAPEQARGEVLTPAADVWGIGIVLYEAATGGLPFAGKDDRYPQLHQHAPPVRASRRLPDSVAETIDACLSPKATDRPQVGAVITALKAAAKAHTS